MFLCLPTWSRARGGRAARTKRRPQAAAAAAAAARRDGGSREHQIGDAAKGRAFMLLGGRVDPRVVLKTHARLEIGAFEFGGLGRRWAPLCPFDPSGAGRLTRGAGAGSGPTWRFVNGQRLLLNTAFQIPGRCGCGTGGGDRSRGWHTPRGS